MEDNYNVEKDESEAEDFCDCSEVFEATEVGGGGEELFDFVKFYNYMKNSIIENSSDVGDVDLGNYLLAYEQLYNFFLLLGKAFHFVALDVKSKIKILQSFKRNEENNSCRNFTTVSTMINYEKSNNLFENSKYVSGSRTLLRLHRGLDFVRNFLKEIYKLQTDTKLSNIAREVYNQTLAPYHTWVVKNAARLAMQFLPTKSNLLKQISDNSEEKLDHIFEIFPDVLETMNTVYDRIQHIYTINKLLDLS